MKGEEGWTISSGDMTVRYTEDQEGHIGLLLFPGECPVEKLPEKKAALDPLVQIQFAGDIYNGGYAPGQTLRNGESTWRMKKKSQELKRQGERKQSGNFAGG